MANPDSAFGLRPVRKIGGGTDFAIVRCNMATGETNNIGLGDPVKLSGTGGSVDQDQIYPGVVRGTAGDPIFGVVVGVCDRLHDDPVYRVASTNTDVLVCLADGVIFHVQEDSDGGSLAVTNIGDNVNFIVANADTNTGQSRVELDSGSSTGDGTGNLKVLRLADVVRNGIRNRIGTNAVWEVTCNLDALANGTDTDA